jgi:hypothetical protein
VGIFWAQRMHKALVFFMPLWVSGCSQIGIEVWDNSGIPTQGECPDTDYDNGGNIEPEPGLCKMGTGFLFSINRRFKG